MSADDAAVVVTLRADLKAYEAALKTAVRQTERAALSAEKAVSGIGKNAKPSFAPLNDNFAKSANQLANDARVMQFQLNDVFSGLASGQGIRALQVQLGQIAQVMSGGGLAAGARTLGTALLGMVSPINLAVVAFGIAASVATAYFFGSTEDAEKAAKAQKLLNEELQRQQELVKKLADSWKEAPAALTQYADKLKNLDQIQERAGGLLATRKNLLAPLGDAMQNLEPQVDKVLQIFERFPNLDIKPLRDRWKLLSDEVKNGGATAAEVRDFFEQLNKTIQRLPLGAARQLGEILVALEQSIVGPLLKVEELDKKMQDLGVHAQSVLRDMLHGFEALTGPFGPLFSALEKLTGLLPKDFSAGGAFLQGVVAMPEGFRQAVTASGNAARAFLQTKAATDAIGASMVNLTDETAIATAKLFTLLPEAARITSAVRSRQQQADAYARYKAGTGGVAAPPGHSRHEVGQAVDIGQGVSMETLRAAVKMVPELEQLDRVSESLYQRDKVHVQLKGTAAKMSEEQARATEQQADATARAQENMQNYLQTLDDQATLQTRVNEINTNSTLNADQKRIAIEVETVLQKALNQAAQDGITLSQQQIANIREKAIAVAQAGNAAIAISEAEKAAAKEAADAAAAAKKAARDQAQALEQLKNTIAGMATSALTGFVQDLRNGTDAAEALYNAVSKIADQLLSMALNMAFKAILAGPTGGILGGGLFAKGGYTGDVSARAPAGIVHGKEFVVNANATRQHRALLESINKGVPGYASGGFVLPRMSSSQPASQAAAQSVDARTTVVNTFDAGSFLSEALSKPDGVKVILNAVRAQPGAFRQAMQS
jgi:hypothetical protein